MKRIRMQLLFAAALAFAGASAAQAFTFESAAPGDGDGGGASRNYLDPQDQIKPQAGSPQRFNDQSQSGQKEGFSLQFGGIGSNPSFDQKYNSNDFFDPTKR
jgi:hypothetical protein